MQRIRSTGIAFVVLAIGLVCSSIALAQAKGDGRTCPGTTPRPNGAQIHTRVFNDCPTSTLTVTNAYPSSISISDQHVDCYGYANLHTWSFSTDGGLTKAIFENCSSYRFCANVVLTGTGSGEGGLRLAPWWSPDADGKFMLNTGGEIACFGGRLPFYSFTANYGVTYTKGVNAFMEIIYNPNTLSASNPATIEYHLQLGSGPLLSSGPRAFDQGNTLEDPPHGLWGELVSAYAGGYFQPYLGQGVDVGLAGQWTDICYQRLGHGHENNSSGLNDVGESQGQNLGQLPAAPTTWGRLKTLYR